MKQIQLILKSDFFSRNHRFKDKIAKDKKTPFYSRMFLLKSISN